MLIFMLLLALFIGFLLGLGIMNITPAARRRRRSPVCHLSAAVRSHMIFHLASHHITYDGTPHCAQQAMVRFVAKVISGSAANESATEAALSLSGLAWSIRVKTWRSVGRMLAVGSGLRTRRVRIALIPRWRWTGIVPLTSLWVTSIVCAKLATFISMLETSCSWWPVRILSWTAVLLFSFVVRIGTLLWVTGARIVRIRLIWWVIWIRWLLLLWWWWWWLMLVWLLLIRCASIRRRGAWRSSRWVVRVGHYRVFYYLLR